MAGKIRIDAERCKGCGLCVEACPRQSLRMSAGTNRTGYFFAEGCGVGCIGCGICALVCPDVAIEVWREGPGAPEPEKVKEARA